MPLTGDASYFNPYNRGPDRAQYTTKVILIHYPGTLPTPYTHNLIERIRALFYALTVSKFDEKLIA